MMGALQSDGSLDLHCSDAEWYEATGNCGRCGLVVMVTTRTNDGWYCTCAECGCGPHGPLDDRHAVEDTTLPLFEKPSYQSDPESADPAANTASQPSQGVTE